MGGKLDFDRSSAEPIFTKKIASHSFQTPHQASRKPEVSSRTIKFEIRPKLEALGPKYYREIQQSKLDRTVGRISCAGLQQSRRLFLSDWMIANNALSKIRPAGGEAGASKQRPPFSYQPGVK